MKSSQYARMVWRESRGSLRRLLFFMACLALGVGAIVAVAGLSASLEGGIRVEARRLLGADLTVEARRPMPDALDDLLAESPAGKRGLIERTDVREMATIVAAPPRDGVPGPSQLCEVKVVDGRFPLHGELLLEPAGSLDALLDDESVVVGEDLPAQIGVKPGDDLRIGGTSFRIAGIVRDEPAKLNFSFSMGPRVFMTPGGLERAGLQQYGSRIEYQAMLRLPGDATAEQAKELAEFLELHLPDAVYYDVDTFAEAQPALRRGLERMGHFLGLVGLLSLLIGGVGVAQTVRTWIAARMDAIAVLRCMGMRPREAAVLFAGQALLMALLGSIAGVLLGVLAQWLVPKFAGDVVPAAYIRPWQLWPILRGLGMGVAVAMLFSLPPLLSVRRIPPVRVFRAQAEPVRTGWPMRLVTGALLAGGIWVIAMVQADSWWVGSVFAACLLGAIVMLSLVAIGLMKLVKMLPTDRGGLWLRHGVARLVQPGAGTVPSVVALGLGVMIVLGLHLIERHLSEELDGELPETAPSSFLVDVQPHQWVGVKQVLEEQDAKYIEVVPLVMVRIRAIEGSTIDDIMEGRRPAPTGVSNPGDPQRGNNDRGRRWAMTREQRLTYTPDLPSSNTILEGRWWSDDIANEISIEEDFARDLGVGIGSTLTLDVQGVPIEVTVTSLRQVDWRSFNVNFFLIVEPGVLDDAPQLRIATAQLPEGGDQKVQDALAASYPNITLIRIRDMLGKVMEMLGRVAIAIQLLSGLTLAAGGIILAGAISAGYVQRGREVALLKTLGMTRQNVMSVFAIEYALIGLCAAAIGCAAASVLAWFVITNRMELDWAHRPATYAIAIGLTMGLAVAAGLAASTRALRSRPIEVLRTQ